MTDEIPSEHAIRGIHHITLICQNVQRTANFYVRTLGLQFVKKTVNFDRPGTYHLYFGDDVGHPGTLVTFFEWPDAAPGRVGVGTTHHFALTVDSFEALLKWKTRLQHARHIVAGPHDHGVYQNIIVTDPDGVIVELATAGPGLLTPQPPRSSSILSDTWPEPVTSITPDMQIRGLHHISPISTDIQRTDDFYSGLLGIPCILRTDDEIRPHSSRWYWSTEDGKPGTVVTYEGQDPASPTPHGVIGHGVTHHFAFDVPTDQAQIFWRDRLLAAGLDVTPVLDRKYFHSIYFADPDGHILEIATTQPGFLVDQTPDQLGRDLALPTWLESQRAKIESGLDPIHLP